MLSPEPWIPGGEGVGYGVVCACPPGDVDIEGNVCMGTGVRQGVLWAREPRDVHGGHRRERCPTMQGRNLRNKHCLPFLCKDMLFFLMS